MTECVANNRKHPSIGWHFHLHTLISQCALACSRSFLSYNPALRSKIPSLRITKSNEPFIFLNQITGYSPRTSVNIILSKASWWLTRFNCLLFTIFRPAYFSRPVPPVRNRPVLTVNSLSVLQLVCGHQIGPKRLKKNGRSVFKL